MTQVIRVHGTCVARSGAGVLLLGPAGAGKSDLALRLMPRGFDLVADDQVLIEDGRACSPPSLAGMLEIRGLGIVRLPFVTAVRLALAVELGLPDRMPCARQHRELGLPLVRVRPDASSAPERVSIALDCALGIVPQVAGAFAP